MENKARIMEPADYKKIITEMLGFVHRVCVDNDIRYCVGYGSLIGAVRHGGIIPWDDDIDIWMHGDDYDRFVEAFEKGTDDYYLLSPDNSPNYYNIMTRICAKSGILKLKGVIDIDNLGPFIDIFPVYKAPEDQTERLALIREIRDRNHDVRYSLPLRYYRTLTFRQKLQALLRILRRLGKRLFVGTAELKKRRKQLVTKYGDTDSGLYFAVTDVSKVSDKRSFSEEELFRVEPHRFEDIEVMIPTAYDAILTRLYGNYMELPPVEKRVSKHHFVPYWR